MKKLLEKSSTKPFNNSKTKKNSIKYNRFGKSKTLILLSIKKVMKTEDGFSLTLNKKDLFLKIN